MNNQARAILWAQWRNMRNFYPRKGLGGLIWTVVMSLIWYSMWALAAWVMAQGMANPNSFAEVRPYLPVVLAGIFAFWQLVPVVMASTGMSLDLRKLLVYPVHEAQLFKVDVLLRLTAGIEMLLLLIGMAAGILRNPRLPAWGVLALLPFILLNLFFSAAIRDILVRFFARKRMREVGMLLMFIVMVLPQFLMARTEASQYQGLIAVLRHFAWPWTAVATLAVGKFNVPALGILALWCGAAYWFGRWQFHRTIRFDPDAGAKVKRADEPRARRPGLSELFYQLPSRLLRDPLGGLTEKEVRFLSRAPRFRVIFAMGFTFGFLVWAPLAFTRGSEGAGPMTENFLTFVSVYALMLIGEVTVWNAFGFDRSAAQAYFALPIPLRQVLIAKNLTALLAVLLNIAIVTLVATLLQLPLQVSRIGEAFAVTVVYATVLLGIGNIFSVRYARGIDPSQTWKSSAGKHSAMLLLIYPAVSIPIAMAYLARWAFDTDAAFYAVLAVVAVCALAAYWVATDTALEIAQRRREELLAGLTEGGGLTGL